MAFSDGVFAVAITLLVIDLRLPPVEGGDAAIWDALLTMGPKLLIFVFTFIIIGMSWLGHHRKFSYIRQVNSGLLWLNLFYLLTLCLIPFATGVLSEHGDRFAFILYAVVMTLVSMLSAALSAYGLREPFLANRILQPGVRPDMILSPFFTAIVFLMSAAVAFGGRMKIAHWILLLIMPVSAFFGSRTRKAA
ncbi:TMEM175 family protein [Rhodopila sp.]|uniref:TMEM175 family protein n=1 Tax=Rhodopila sp. TaxID=2480087 RepID=UPI003D0D9B93